MSILERACRRTESVLRESRYRLLRPFGDTDYRRFVVLSRSRTGSTLLVSYLNSHPNVRCEGEVFGRLDGRPYEKTLARIFAREPRHIRAKGFKLFYYHPVDGDGAGLWNDLRSMQDLHVLQLRRRNTLRILVSRKLAEATGAWARKDRTGAVVEKEPIHLSMDEARAAFEETARWEREGAAAFADHPLLALTYEELTSAPESEFGRVTDFLGVPAQSPRSVLGRQNPEPLSALIRNFEELERGFRGSEWQHFFRE